MEKIRGNYHMGVTAGLLASGVLAGCGGDGSGLGVREARADTVHTTVYDTTRIPVTIYDTTTVHDTVTILTSLGDTIRGLHLDVITANIEEKVTTRVIDPVYEINGKFYSTFVPWMSGENLEETTGTSYLRNGSVEIDFDEAPIGSNRWLFGQVSDFGSDMENLRVLVTTGFDGKIWYTKDSADNSVTFNSDGEGEISYRFTAPRKDSEEH